LSLKSFLKKEDGSLSLLGLGMGAIALIILFFVLLWLFMGVYTKCTRVYGEMDSALEFAVAAAAATNPTAFSGNYEDAPAALSVINDHDVYTDFTQAYCQITKGQNSGNTFNMPKLPGPVKVKSFHKVYPGDDVPPPPILPGLPQIHGEKALQPGYVVHIEAPIWGGWWTLEPVTVEMRSYKILQGVTEGQS
jgi:hypothetical protein